MPKAKFRHGEKRVVTLKGESWDIIAVRPSALTHYRKGQEPVLLDGTCAVPAIPNSRMDRKHRKIYFRNNMDSADLLETLIHEMDHSQQPDRAEEYVAADAKEQADVLVMYGFTRKGHDGG